jgi:shikimate dehydrogenase
VITGATRIAGVIGDPVRHSLSPKLHNAAYRALDLDWVFLAFEVPDGGARAALDAARVLGFVGLSVTMPHKTAVADLCDELSPGAAALRSVNTVVVSDGRTTGHSTDGDGFLRSLTDAGVEVAGRSVLVLGGGGAARAVARALAGACARVEVSARRAAAAAVAAGLANGGAVGWTERAAAAAAADIVVNATPVGMAGDPMLPIPEHVLGPGRAVVDLVYEPLETPLLAAARARGAVAVSGLGMLVHQAARQVELWSGRPAPIAAMQAAVKQGADPEARTVD